MADVIYRAAVERDLDQILTLQRRYLEESLDPAEVAADGFVTVRHDRELLAAMNAAEPHVVAVSGDQVAGYALVMLRSFADRIAILEPMFAQMRAGLVWDGVPLDEYRYFIMGQVCVDKPFRGSGVFAGMFEKMRELYRGRYDFTITEVARRNARSIRAHEKVGFGLLHRYRDPSGEEWDLILWDWTPR